MVIGRRDHTDNWTSIWPGISTILGDIWQGFGSTASAHAAAAEGKAIGIRKFSAAAETERHCADQGTGQ